MTEVNTPAPDTTIGQSRSSLTAQKPIRKARSERKTTVESARSKLDDEIQKLRGQITRLEEFCTSVQNTPDKCTGADGKTASRQIGQSVERLCGKLDEWRQAQAAEHRQQFSELLTLLDGKLNVGAALKLAREGAQSDAIASALVADQE